MQAHPHPLCSSIPGVTLASLWPPPGGPPDTGAWGEHQRVEEMAFCSGQLILTSAGPAGRCGYFLWLWCFILLRSSTYKSTQLCCLSAALTRAHIPPSSWPHSGGDIVSGELHLFSVCIATPPLPTHFHSSDFRHRLITVLCQVSPTWYSIITVILLPCSVPLYTLTALNLPFLCWHPSELFQSDVIQFFLLLVLSNAVYINIYLE